MTRDYNSLNGNKVTTLNFFSGDPIKISNKKEGVYESLYYEVQVVLNKKRKSKSDCVDYENANDFAECVDRALKE